MTYDYRSRPATHGSIRATTPTQQEQDALDSLISMSSPAHSLHYSRRYPNGTSAAASTAASSAHGSPTRAAFPVSSHVPSKMPPPLRAGSSGGSGGSGDPSEWAANVRQDGIKPSTTRSDGTVDRLLDEMRAYSSGDED